MIQSPAGIVVRSAASDVNRPVDALTTRMSALRDMAPL